MVIVWQVLEGKVDKRQETMLYKKICQWVACFLNMIDTYKYIVNYASSVDA